MFDAKSRYANVETAVYVTADGTEHRYVKRRFLPHGSDLPVLTVVHTVQNQRLDQIAFATLGDPLAAWRIADANDAMNPFDLVKETDEALIVPVPTP